MAVFQLDFEIFRTIASFTKISSGHSLIIKIIFISPSGQFEKKVDKCPETVA